MLKLPNQPRLELNPTVRFLFVTIIGLMAVGILMVYSASLSANPDEKYVAFGRHILFVPLAIGGLLLAMWFPYHRLNRSHLAIGLMVLTVALLVAVLFCGTVVNGARRWFRIPLGFMELSFQPSELAKLSVILFFAWFLSRDPSAMGSWREAVVRRFLPLVVILGVVCGLIAMQDLGTAVLIATVGGCLMLAGGIRWWQLAALLPPAAGGLYFMIMRHPYRVERLASYRNPFQDPQGAGYHMVQSLIAIGSGGWLGLGLGNGIQKLGYLPEDTTDFIFSIICEEMGIIGGILVILMFLALALLGLRIVGKANNRFAYLLALGIVLWTTIQALINIGVATAALPTKGIALPLVSSGGTGLLLTAAALGLLMSVGVRSPELSASPARAAAPAGAPLPASAVASSASSRLATPASPSAAPTPGA